MPRKKPETKRRKIAKKQDHISKWLWSTKKLVPSNDRCIEQVDL